LELLGRRRTFQHGDAFDVTPQTFVAPIADQTFAPFVQEFAHGPQTRPQIRRESASPGERCRSDSPNDRP
jgi:hypothetical protein